MAPICTQYDKCESVVIVGTTKRSLHIGKSIYRWLEQSAIRVRIGSPDITNIEAQAYY